MSDGLKYANFIASPSKQKFKQLLEDSRQEGWLRAHKEIGEETMSNDFVVAEKALEEELIDLKLTYENEPCEGKRLCNVKNSRELGTNKPIPINTDIIDALGVALFCLRERRELKKWLEKVDTSVGDLWGNVPYDDKNNEADEKAVLVKEVLSWFEEKEKGVKQK